jgi:hypothetical protein
LIPEYEEQATKLRAEVSARREEYQQACFGMPESSSPYADVPTKHVAQMNYRDSLFKLQDATPEQLTRAADLAEATGDQVLS